MLPPSLIHSHLRLDPSSSHAEKKTRIIDRSPRPKNGKSNRFPQSSILIKPADSPVVLMMSDVFLCILAMVQNTPAAELMRSVNIVRRQGFEPEDRNAVAHEVEVLHVTREVICYGGETG